MREIVEVTGMVMKAGSVGEYDRRLVLLTLERGKITAFARGAKRPGNSLMGVCRPFVFGKFKVYEGRESYSLQGAEIGRYFEELGEDLEGSCYGQYFLEVADYYIRENMDGRGMLLLVYQSLRALLNPRIPNRLVRRVFELKAMVLNGEYTEKPPVPVSESACYTWEFVVMSPVEKLYTFVVTEQVLEEFGRCVEVNRGRYIDREFHSLEVLEMMKGE